MFRREFWIIAAFGALFALGFVSPASAQDVSVEELMQPGPLGDEALGDDKAPVTIVEYASMTCPHCAHFATTTFPKLKEQYIDTGKVRFIFREFPFDDLAAGAFMLARCAPKDQYFPLIEVLFQQQDKWVVRPPASPADALLTIVKQAGFTKQSFEECLANQKILDGIEQVRNRAVEKFKVDSTPTFFINGKRLKGDISLEELEKAIKS
jgi:protein-disulfide isomerase